MELKETPVKQEVKRGFKKTEVGMIPEDWTLADLASLCDTITDGTHYTPQYVPAGVPFLSVENVTGNDFSNTKFITPEEHAFLIRRCKPEKGDILLTRIGDLGSTKLIDWEFEASIYVSLALLKVRKDVSAEYLYAYSKSRLFVTSMEKRSLLNAAPKKTNMGDIGGIPIPLPPSKSEQRAIATALSDVDGLLAGLDALIAKKKALKQGAMQQLLTGKQRLPGFKGEWVVRRLGDLAHIKTGSRNNEDKVEGGAYPFFVRSEHIERINSYSQDCEAILVPGEGRIGEIFHYIKGKFDVHQRVYAITQFSPDVSARFIHAYLRQYFGAWAMQNTVKATVDSLRLPTFQNFELTIPPDVQEQTAIAEVLSDMDAELGALEARRAKTALLKQGMMQELLTGRVRLV